MKRKAKSRAWMHEHVADPYVQRAVASGYRSRAAYKLIEIDEHDRLLRHGQTVVDLGAAPGSWAQVIAQSVQPGGRVIAVDLLPMDPVAGVTAVQGDFREQAVLAVVIQALGGQKADLVVSDMAPNLSGVGASDQARAAHLCELALEFATANLKPQGAFLVKAFQGTGYPEFLAEMRRCFQSVVSRKPKASRGRSAEMYLLGKELRPRSG
jgi:23S rRNA (uridine2552-2'-O)-methyltransferase